MFETYEPIAYCQKKGQISDTEVASRCACSKDSHPRQLLSAQAQHNSDPRAIPYACDMQDGHHAM